MVNTTTGNTPDFLTFHKGMKGGSMPLPGSKDAEKSLVTEMKTTFGELGKEVIGAKIAQQSLIAESSADGGPTSIQDAISTLVDHAKIGIRELSRKTGVNRKVLLGMIQGRLSMPPEVLTVICELAEKKSPELYAFKNLNHLSNVKM